MITELPNGKIEVTFDTTCFEDETYIVKKKIKVVATKEEIDDYVKDLRDNINKERFKKFMELVKKDKGEI